MLFPTPPPFFFQGEIIRLKPGAKLAVVSDIHFATTIAVSYLGVLM